LAKHYERRQEQNSVKADGKLRRGSHDEVAMMEVMLPKRSASFHVRGLRVT
jgi:hypothetical protein